MAYYYNVCVTASGIYSIYIYMNKLNQNEYYVFNAKVKRTSGCM
jgi:hypothetical protein